MGSLRPMDSRIASTICGVASWPAMMAAGSPGARCIIPNTITPTISIVGTMASTLLKIYICMSPFPPPPAVYLGRGFNSTLPRLQSMGGGECMPYSIAIAACFKELLPKQAAMFDLYKRFTIAALTAQAFLPVKPGVRHPRVALEVMNALHVASPTVIALVSPIGRLDSQVVV